MILSTSLQRAKGSTDEELLSSFENILRTCTQVGFEVLDFNLGHYTRWSSPVHAENWQDWWKRLRDRADEQEISWWQGHAHFVNWEIEPLDDWAWHDELVRRTIVGAGIMGIKTLVLHPKTWPDQAWYSRQASLEVNLESCKRYSEWAAPYDLTLAIENMSEKRKGRRFGSGPEELLELIDLLNDPKFGICWDTGHAHISGIDQVEALRLIAPHLKALHIHDNHGEKDNHLMPLDGTIDWASLVQVLREINYRGCFSFEVIYQNDARPSALYTLFTETLYELGQYLLT